MTKKDIVARLRDCDQGLMADCETHVDLITDFSCVEDAAKLIEQLRERNCLLLQQRGCRDEAARRAARRIEMLKIEVGQLTKERDDARLEIWEHHPRNTLEAREYADARGWAPFMEENDNA